jgi:ParB/RepB/Spo0J family partition protein
MANTAAAATVTPLHRARDSAGISPAPAAVLVSVPLEALAPHPHNPRVSLGDLADLTASIQAQGLFEPLVVLTAAAYTAAAEADGDLERPAAGITHVNVMGHRRAEACRAAGLAEVPVIVRDDLAGAPALAAMVAENMHREDLTPLAEAGAFAELARRGWRQRKIATETGCSQAHVSKRLALLRLPDDARTALAAGTITVADAQELHKLTGGSEDAATEDAISRAVASIAKGWSAEGAVNEAQGKLRRARTEQATRDKLAAEGVRVVTEQQRARGGWPRLHGDIAPHAGTGCLAALIDWSGDPDYVCTNPAGHPGTARSREARAEAERHETDREGRKAAKARDAACQQVAAARMPAAGDLVQQLAAALITGGGGGYSDALRLAYRWLRDSGIVSADQDHYQARAGLLATPGSDPKTLQRYAYAYCLAIDELYTRSRGYGAPTWSARHTAHLARLTEHAAYQPTPWEARQLAVWRACQDARGTLACPACGCTRTKDCGIRYDTDQGKPVFACASFCSQHHGKASQSEHVGETETIDRDALFDAIEEVVSQLDRTRLHLLPDEAAEALEGPASTLADVLASQAGNGPLIDLTTAASAVLTAGHSGGSLPAEVAAALEALAAVLPAAEAGR